MKMIFITILMLVPMAKGAMAQPEPNYYFEIVSKPTFQSAVAWISIDDDVSVNIEGETFVGSITGYKENGVEIVSIDSISVPADTVFAQKFQIVTGERVSLDFPSQALPLKSLKGKLKSEAESQLGLVYTGTELAIDRILP